MVEISLFQLLWFILLAVLMVGYFVLDGFDLGVGILYPFLGKDEQERAAMRLAIGPVWDGNEVWLLTLGGALFAAFPPAYATVFSGFYLAIMVVLFALILRAVSIHFIGHLEGAARGLFTVTFFLGSLLPALLYGVACGNLINTVPLLANGDVAGDFPQRFVQLLGLLPLLCGVLTLVLSIALGASWLKGRVTEGALHERAAKTAKLTALLGAVLFVIVGVVYLFVVAPQLPEAGEKYLLSGIPQVVRIAGGIVACAALVGAGMLGGKARMVTFILTALGTVGVIAAFAGSMFPSLVPAGDPAFAPMAAENLGQTITIAAPYASSELTLQTMLVIACIGVPLVLIYHVLSYRAFSGKIEIELLADDEDAY
ncbi:MAG: cytochrome d ubiquinol oxidase subunit II [Coriobacteriia bacterium]|nr:cytochrome d ubiquinol oxidase subunit II [Coriobacteriia bacterium]MBS5478014.1 cytochrome d ubiquinol oxidase subunit II [Coriobacteriia bacterium]